MLAALLVLAPPATHAAVSAADRLFLKHEARSGFYELAIAQLAARKATREDIKAYTQRIILDHEQASAALQHLAQNKGVQLLTGMTNDEQKLGRDTTTRPSYSGNSRLWMPGGT